MQVSYDPQTFLRQRNGGISRLFADLISFYDQEPSFGITVNLPLSISNNTYLTKELPHRSIKQTPTWVPRSVLYSMWWLLGNQFAQQTDLVHHTYYDKRFLSFYPRSLRVVTVYDMIPEKLVETSGFTGSHLDKFEYVRRSDLVICISESTRSDMFEIYGDIDAHSVVIPLAVGSGFKPGLPAIPGWPGEYLLYVGKRGGYKDFHILPEVLAELRAIGLEIPLVAVGQRFSRDEKSALRTHKVEDLVTCVRLDDTALKSAYANATAIVQTSSYEGFGLTPLEGMASGKPVVIAKSSSMPEVGGDVARYFRPGDSTSLAATLAEVLSDDAQRDYLGSQGILRAQEFTSQLLAERTAAAYQTIAS